VLTELGDTGFHFDPSWFAPHFEFRFPRVGELNTQGISLTLRNALEPWHVMGEEGSSGGTVRYVDSSLERIEVHVTGLNPSRHTVTVNGRALPLQPTGTVGEFVAGVRYRAWAPSSALHPTIGVHVPLTFDIVDTWMKRSVELRNPASQCLRGREPTSVALLPDGAHARQARHWPSNRGRGSEQGVSVHTRLAPLNPAPMRQCAHCGDTSNPNPN
jgi:uncharacterized protein (DUF2126 family)